MGTVTEIERVQLDLAAPAYRLTEGDRKVLGTEDPVMGAVRATQFVLRTAVTTHFAQGMENHNARIWSRWQKVLDGDSREVEVSNPDFEWLWKIYSADSLKLPAALSSWRVLLENHLLDVRDSLRKQE
jgi:hypothetical protein